MFYPKIYYVGYTATVLVLFLYCFTIAGIFCLLYTDTNKYWIHIPFKWKHLHFAETISLAMGILSFNWRYLCLDSTLHQISQVVYVESQTSLELLSKSLQADLLYFRQTMLIIGNSYSFMFQFWKRNNYNSTKMMITRFPSLSTNIFSTFSYLYFLSFLVFYFLC